VFEFSTVGRILFGIGVSNQLPELVLRHGQRALIVTGANADRARALVEAIERAGLATRVFSVGREPTVEDVTLGLAASREHEADVVVGIGGGSALDLAKAVAAVAANPGVLTDYLEVVGLGKSLARPGLPCIAVPTTSGTGAEVTRNAVIELPQQCTKVSLRGEHVLPRVAVVDPQLSLSLPASMTAGTGLDALVQVIEPYVSNRNNPMTDALVTAAIRLAARSLRRAFECPSDLAARSDMALVSLWGGICLTNARLGAVHGLAGPIGGMFHAHHGVICGSLLAPVMRVNVAACREAEQVATLERYAEVARLVTGYASATIEQGIEWIENLTASLAIPTLRGLGVNADRFDEIVDRAIGASSMQGNPIRLSSSQIRAVLERAL
jgi:alcohol dehydrogenase class IV